MLLIYSFTLWSHCGDFLQWKRFTLNILTYKLLECDDKHFIFFYLTNMIWKKSCTVYSLIFMLEMLQRCGPHMLLCIQLWISTGTFSVHSLFCSLLKEKMDADLSLIPSRPSTDIIFRRKHVNSGSFCKRYGFKWCHKSATVTSANQRFCANVTLLNVHQIWNTHVIVRQFEGYCDDGDTTTRTKQWHW